MRGEMSTKIFEIKFTIYAEERVRRNVCGAPELLSVQVIL